MKCTGGFGRTSSPWYAPHSSSHHCPACPTSHFNHQLTATLGSKHDYHGTCNLTMHTGAHRNSCKVFTPICINSNCHAGMHLNTLVWLACDEQGRYSNLRGCCSKDASPAMSEKHARSSILFLYFQAISKQHDKGEACWDG